jgi:tumor protein p53-inducible protein 3
MNGQHQHSKPGTGIALERAALRGYEHGMSERNEADRMRAVVILKPGGPEELQIQEVVLPALTPGCVDIDVRATALNRADLLQRRGLYAPPPGASDILGLECAGVVRRVGPGVSGFAPGDRVMALLPGGGYAERVVAPAELCMRVPASLGFNEAAAIPEAFLTASEALFTLGRLGTSDVVLIHAAAGGVGSAAVQLAKRAGARVIACVGNDAKAAWLAPLGPDRVVKRHEEDFVAACSEVTSGRGVDVVLDFVGASYAERHQRCLAEAGRWIVLGLLGGTRSELDFAFILRKRLELRGLVMRTRTLADKQAIVERFSRRFLADFDAGTLSPLIDRVYPLSRAGEAHARMEQNENLGKIVLEVQPDAADS